MLVSEFNIEICKRQSQFKFSSLKKTKISTKAFLGYYIIIITNSFLKYLLNVVFFTKFQTLIINCVFL